jgi:uncharacterized membrane protein HdeD (DUF308 family)
VTATPSARAFEVRHLQIARAAVAAIAALMLTFSPDHSAAVGLTVFSGFAITTAFVFAAAAWLVFPRGRRWPAVSLAAISFAAAALASVQPLRGSGLFFGLVIGWAAVSGLVELIAGIRERRSSQTRVDARDTITVGILGLVLAAGLAVVPSGYSLDYFIDDAGPQGTWFTLTGTTIGVGLFGGYAAIVAVWLAIAGFSPRRTPAVAGEREPEEADA